MLQTILEISMIGGCHAPEMVRREGWKARLAREEKGSIEKTLLLVS
jgi:hypothetical protein